MSPTPPSSRTERQVSARTLRRYRTAFTVIAIAGLACVLGSVYLLLVGYAPAWLNLVIGALLLVSATGLRYATRQAEHAQDDARARAAAGDRTNG